MKIQHAWKTILQWINRKINAWLFICFLFYYFLLKFLNDLPRKELEPLYYRTSMISGKVFVGKFIFPWLNHMAHVLRGLVLFCLSRLFWSYCYIKNFVNLRCILYHIFTNSIFCFSSFLKRYTNNLSVYYFTDLFGDGEDLFYLWNETKCSRTLSYWIYFATEFIALVLNSLTGVMFFDL